MKRLFQIISVLLIVGTICFATDTKVPSSHRSILQHLAHSAIRMAVEENASHSFTAVSFFMDSTGLHSVVRDDLINSLLSKNIYVYTHPSSADTIVRCLAQDPFLSYGDVFSESWFGARRVERTLSLTLQVTFSSHSMNAILYSKKFIVSNTDTVLYSDIQNLEDPSLPVRSMSLPQLSLFDSLFEPMIITVASAVAIYLFFTIRS